jgi:uncharacterized protein (DUF2062 family)
LVVNRRQTLARNGEPANDYRPTTNDCFRMKDFLQKRLIRPIVQLLTQGITPEKIALSLAFGFMLGIFPVLGTTSLLCLIAAMLFRLNLPAVQLVNVLVNPLWFALLIPFIRLGEWLFGVPPLAMTASQILALSHTNLLHSISVLWLTALRAAAAWLLVGPVGIIVLYLILLPMIRRLARLQLPGTHPSEDLTAS